MLTAHCWKNVRIQEQRLSFLLVLENKQTDEEIRRLGKLKGWRVAELGDLGEMDSMKAKGKFSHSGVAVHPGDEGMHMIAERIFEMTEVDKR